MSLYSWALLALIIIKIIVLILLSGPIREIMKEK